METPGDENKTSQVVIKVEDSCHSEQEVVDVAPVHSSEPEQLLPSSMTVLGTLPQFDPLPSYSLTSSLSIDEVKLENVEVTPLSNLDQARIEDYFTQSKFYSNVPETLQPLYASSLQKVDKFIPLSVAEPGPSGLQAINVQSSKPPSKKSKKCQLSKKTFTCEVCQKTFINSSKLAKHQLVHNASSPFKCEQCKKTFSTKFKLVRHVLIHSDRKQFSCTVCERTFHRKDHLKNHVKVHSPSKTVYICTKPDCNKEYTSLLSYKKHLALHAAEEGSLICQICSKSFENKEQILYHLKIHAGSRTVKNPNEKKFTCDRCDRKFFTRKDVRRHMVVHTGMRDFLCQFCPQRFGRKDHLVRHIKKSHSKTLQSSQTKLKAETITKAELSESSMSNSESFSGTYFESLFPQTFENLPLLPPEDAGSIEFLPHEASQGDLKDLGLEVLPDIGESASNVLKELESDVAHEFLSTENLTPSSSAVIQENVLIHDSEIMGMLQTDENLPLPGFSQTFQSPPPQPPPSQ